ncbi:MAG TPA: DNA primase [Actinomycetota bacterium]|nr:DNA primase [Actinomycetota bacterium]
MAKIREADVDALRERADIVEIVSGYSRLKRAGGRTFKGLCPFHSEKTPSFTVDAAKGLYHCFGCGEGGNVYHFVQKIENLPFPEAAEWLARKVGMELTYEESRPGERRAHGVKLRLLQANDAAAAYFHESLLRAPDAKPARDYLSGRGFGRDVAERWMLGYAPGRDALCRHLLDRRFSVDEILQADLGRRSERDGRLYDTFRNRIVFPTWNVQGDVAGFGARAMGDAQPKYLNTSETPVFAKSRLMYGLDRAKSAIARDQAVVVEGYTDVIALHEAGLTNAVATNGVALGDAHFEMLKKFTSRVVLMFDADEAGKGATERGFELQHRIGLEVLVAPLPPGRDPADVVAQDGPDAIRKVLAAAQPLLEFMLDQTLARARLDTPEARARAARTAAELLRRHPDPIARHQYAFTAARRIGVEPEAVALALGERGRGDDEVDVVRERRLPGHVKVERAALQLLLVAPGSASRWADDVRESDFTSPARRELFRAVRAPVGAAPAGGAGDLASRLSPEALSLFTELTVGADDVGGDEVTDRARELFVRLRVFRLERDIKKKRDVLQEMNPLDDPRRHDDLFTELVGLEAERRDLLRRLDGGA